MFLASAIFCLRVYTVPGAAFFGHDSWQYQQMAVNLAAGHGLRIGTLLPYEEYQFLAEIQPDYGWVFDFLIETGERGGEHVSYRQPGYPFLLGVLYAMIGVRPDVAMLLQMVTIIAIGAFLPILGERMLGPTGYFAGLAAGLVVSLVVAERARSIMTETLITFACFMILVAWIRFVRRCTTSSGILFGLTLAFAVLVKGSLIFIPPLFLSYMIARGGKQSQAFTRSRVALVALAFLAPVLAYSMWVSSWEGQAIYISTQGRDVLLDGHNELALESGQWSPDWKNDPSTFYSRTLARDGERGTLALVAGYYLARPGDLFRIARRKIEVIGQDRELVSRLAVNGVPALGLVWVSLVALSGANVTTRVTVLVAITTALVWSGFDTVVSFAGLSIALPLGAASPAFRKHVRAMWEDPHVCALCFMVLNFLLLTIVTFALERFVLPAFFILLLVGFHLAFRIAERVSTLRFVSSRHAASECETT